MRQWTGSVLFQVMDCRQFGAKPLPKPMLQNYKLDPWEQTLVKFQWNASENVVCWMAAISPGGGRGLIRGKGMLVRYHSLLHWPFVTGYLWIPLTKGQ